MLHVNKYREKTFCYSNSEARKLVLNGIKAFYEQMQISWFDSHFIFLYVQHLKTMGTEN